MNTFEPVDPTHHSGVESGYASPPRVINGPENDARTIAQNRISALGLAMLVLAIVLGAAGSHLTAVSPEIVKVIAVVIFVGSMLALALGMIGETYRR